MTYNRMHWKFKFLYQSRFCPGRWIQRRVGWWSSRQRSKLQAWTRTCPKPRWTGCRKYKICFLRKLFSNMTMNWQCNGSECKKENVKTHPDEEVDHEEDVEGEVDLLGGVLHPRGACFHTIPESGDWTMSKESKGSLCDTNCLYFHFSICVLSPSSGVRTFSFIESSEGEDANKISLI